MISRKIFTRPRCAPWSREDFTGNHTRNLEDGFWKSTGLGIYWLYVWIEKFYSKTFFTLLFFKYGSWMSMFPGFEMFLVLHYQRYKKFLWIWLFLVCQISNCYVHTQRGPWPIQYCQLWQILEKASIYFQLFELWRSIDWIKTS